MGEIRSFRIVVSPALSCPAGRRADAWSGTRLSRRYRQSLVQSPFPAGGLAPGSETSQSRLRAPLCLTQWLPCPGPAELAQCVVVRQEVTERFSRIRRRGLGRFEVSEQ